MGFKGSAEKTILFFSLLFAKKARIGGSGLVFGNTILAEIITKKFIGIFSFAINFEIIAKLIPPEDFLCNVAASGVSLFARSKKKAK